MSARREKRLRKLERRVETLEQAKAGMDEELERIQRANEEYWKGAIAPYQTLIKTTPYQTVIATTLPRRSLWRRLLDFLKGRDNP